MINITQYKKVFGEVFTPVDLVNKMLDKLPSEIWENKNLTWCDPSCGSGNFLYHVKLRLMEGLSSDIIDEKEREKWIVEQMLYGVELQKKNSYLCMFKLDPNNEFKLNIVCADSLNFDFWGMKFDMVVGNPPYQNNMYKEFTILAKSLTKQYLLFIIPSTFMTQTTGEKFKNIIINQGLNSINFLPTRSFKMADVATIYFLWSVKESEEVIINDFVKTKNRSLIFDCHKQEEISIWEKLFDMPKLSMYKGKNETLDFHKPQPKDFLSDVQTSKHNHKMLSRLGGGDIQYLWTSNVKEDTQKAYLAFPRGTASWNSCSRLKDTSRHIVFSTYIPSGVLLSTALVAIEVANQEAAAYLRWYLMQSKVVRWLFLRFNLAFSELTHGMIQKIPVIPLDGSIFSDIDLYKHFNFTLEEINIIEEIFQ